MATARTPSAPPAHPAVAGDESAEPLIGYPAAPVEGQTVYGYPPPSLTYNRPDLCGGRFGRICACLCCLLLFIIAVAAFFAWPRSPGFRIDDVSLGKVDFQIKREGSILPIVYLNLTLDFQLEAKNPNCFDVTYKIIIVSICYHDVEISKAESNGGDFQARSTTTLDATLELNSSEVASNVPSLLADVQNDAVPLKVTLRFDGYVNVLWFKIPLEADVTCNMVINPDDQVIVSQSCSV